MRIRLALLGLLGSLHFGLTACKQNPFPSGRVFSDKKQEPPTPTAAAYIIDIPEFVEMNEGTTQDIIFTATVPSPGTPIVTVQDLPKGAVFSAQESKIKWSVPFDAGNDPADPKVIVRSYPLTLTLFSSENKVTSVSKRIVLVVHDAPRRFQIISDATAKVSEGALISYPIQIQHEDFPQGPFQFQVEGLPASATVVKNPNDPTKYTIRYQPTYSDVTVSDKGGSPYYKYVDIKLSAKGPRGSFTDSSIVWEVDDVRQSTKVSGPTSITQGLDVNFTLNAEDPNAEVAPTIRLRSQPSVGKVSMAQLLYVPHHPDEINPTSTVAVRWNEIPIEKNGLVEDLKFDACVYRKRSDQSHCTVHNVRVTIAADVHAPPTIDRTQWSLGVIKYVRLNDKPAISLPISSTDGKLSRVEITGLSNPREATWSANTLTLAPVSEGSKQLSVTATSSFNASRTESFFFEVLPSTWASTLALGTSSTDVEVTPVLPAFGSVQVANPELQQLDTKTVSLRDFLFSGTGPFGTPKGVQQLESAAVRIKNVIIATPLLKNLNAELLQELTDNGVEFAGRFLDQSGTTDPLNKWVLEPTTKVNIPMPVNTVFLNGALTGESVSPMLVNIKRNGACVPALELKNKRIGKFYTIGVLCNRRSGGKLLVTGFEWGDLMLTSSDRDLIKNWIIGLVKP